MRYAAGIEAWQEKLAQEKQEQRYSGFRVTSTFSFAWGADRSEFLGDLKFGMKPTTIKEINRDVIEVTGLNTPDYSLSKALFIFRENQLVGLLAIENRTSEQESRIYNYLSRSFGKPIVGEMSSSWFIPGGTLGTFVNKTDANTQGTASASIQFFKNTQSRIRAFRGSSQVFAGYQ